MILPIFHLALPVLNLEDSRRFYVELFGARVGRVRDAWIDIHLFGGQITLHHQPAQVLPKDEQGVRHFGAVVSWEQWEELAARLTRHGVEFKAAPKTSNAGTPAEQAKFKVCDPSGNVVEVKAYRNPTSALEIE
ncbi:MAG: VOC family protein [Acidobacteriota bacterium]